ncbi:probable inactive histone-lysine N-methyltransferase SUVR2 [Elaeis guineensis]|uniref:Probable inactive histone-lysine N-methyltransferase SUVR2 n=1 Tax=Elaeis guineensis var. tenera TaxID=51953 RepID=A0A6I9S125_ELAGV|nr:probable inactive histone-lysine N-methyltransferase SUVR2 [Elaeis guineensis]XP_029123575.1 probable inactive histone-lysine N-methyltransferase SUVR2 [Elaeis guineensis]
MAPIPERALVALKAMKAIGFPMHVAKPVLKNLLKLYDNNWEYIEAENYRVLADAILDAQESKDVAPKNKIIDDDSSGRHNDVLASDEPGPYRTSLRIRQDDDQLTPSMYHSDVTGESLLKRQKLEAYASPEIHSERRRAELCSSQSNLRSKAVQPISPQPSLRQDMTEDISPQPSHPSERGGPISPQINCRETRVSSHAHQAAPVQADSGSLLKTYRLGRQPAHENPGNAVHFKEPKIEPGTEVLQKNDTADQCMAFIRPKDEPYDDDSVGFETPIAMIYPSHPISNPIPTENKDETSQEDSTMNASTSQANVAEASAVQHDDREHGKEQLPVAAHENGKTSELVSVQEASSPSIDIASSASGEVKLSLTCSPDHPDFRMPSLEALFKMVEDRCLKSYKILQPDFSLMNVMKEMCQCALELGSESAEDKQENFVKITPALESLKKCGVHDILGGMPCSSSASLNLMRPEGSGFTAMNGIYPNQNLGGNNESGRSKKIEGHKVPEASDITPHSLVVVRQPQLVLGDIRPLHDINDISKGEERVRISVVNEFSSEKYPSSFQYIPRNIVYQNAFVDVSLARIGDEDCCADCFGDCVAAAIPCACARETGGEFAYTSDGLLKKKLLDECISMNRDPQKHHHFYCKHCPIERSKNEVTPDPCKGHLVRKFVKECWSKCGCSKQCGNRVVQRGITCHLQVFFTAEGKGWGLRTLEELPRGAFVCEYVGEILTNMELYDRTMQTTGNAKHTYPVLLDADWGSEGVLKDEEALCLDATFYGNVARFINHRCFDANLVEVPVEVETPDHHYYHLAFFTTRKIEALEELTWDYGIDFDDHAHPIKAFQCRCGSRLCRNMKRTKTRARSSVSK